MRVHISQLVPGCVLLRDVNGKSGKPLFRKKTVLTEEFIAFLHAFLLEGVDVYATLADGSKFMPPKREQTAVKEMAGSSKSLTNEADPDNMTVIELYHFAVQQYEQLFRQWQSNAPVNVTQVKQIAQTLFQRLDDFTSIILSLPAFAKKANWPSHRSISLCIMSCYLGKKAGLTQKDCMQIGVAALLCNVGMAKMPSIPAP
ncbi:hypothetical protein P5G51_000625 [Virgibacillus sp. 179-BFC.A HS]|uniref:HD-GYP domain-containing protein n=1 Tax=Tigheibacillus jepli TaxID=3035914 RepID=A0ABU5CE38_9BACI|nr:hypothetical protein [Virgibacillus sp. 179-BFC.A HS]MDY0404112.1 hypothetical protein [Virgibacillus sp. 179-BFC.A HS]